MSWRQKWCPLFYWWSLDIGLLFFSRISWLPRKQITFFILQKGEIVDEGTMVALEGKMVAFLEARC